jgi:serine/threonine protein kinase
MERLPGNGMSLGDYVSAFTKGEIEYEPLASIFRATQEVLECLHERVGVVHGDLHADNILVSYEQDGWKAYIIDVAQSLVANDSVQELAMFDQYGAYGVSLIEEASPSLDMTRLSSEILSEWGKNKSVAELVDTCFRP